MANFEELKGCVLENIEGLYVGSDEVRFYTQGAYFRLYHDQDCCEQVRIEDVCGDVDDLIGTPILLAEEVTNADAPDLGESYPYIGESSFTWTFYKLSTIKGSVTTRWLGESNGYYSERVSLEKVR